MHVNHLTFETLDNEFCKLHKRNILRDPSNGSRLEMAKIEIAFGKFSLLRKFNLGRPPMRIRSSKKNLFVFFHHLSFLIPKVVYFLTLPSFKCTFEPSTI